MAAGNDGAGPGTRAVHLPAHPLPTQTAMSPPVWRTAAWAFDDAAEYEQLLAGTRPGYSYSRIDKPTVDGLAAAVAALESPLENVVGQAFSSGMSAITTTLLALLSTGDRLVLPRQVYGGTYAVAGNTLRRMGIETTYVDIDDLDAVARAAAGARVLYAETLANPTLQVPDLAALAAIAHDHGARLVVDSTFATPAVCRPLEFGVDLVVHSATKYLGGHADVTAGVVVGDAAAIDPVARLRKEIGTTLSPDDAWLVHRGLLTLDLRMRRHSETALAVAAALAEHPRVCRVDYPGLPDSPNRALADKQFTPGLYGGMLTVSPAGGREAGIRFCDTLRLIPNATSLGGVHSKVSHVASTTHRQFDDATLVAADIDPAAVRISVGLEDAHDLIADCVRALDALDADGD